MELILPIFESDMNLSEVRMSLVTGTMDSMPETLKLFADILNILDRQILCVIDGLHWLDDRSANSILMDLVKTLRQAKVKVLFTTSGRSACLRQVVDRTETLQVGRFDMRGSDTIVSEQTLGMSS
jgi:hypothetical protein